MPMVPEPVLEVECEEEYLDKWVDEFGRWWSRSEVYPGGGSCMTLLMAWSGGTSPGRAGELLWSFCPSLYNDRCRSGFLLSTSPSSCVSLRWLLEEFLHFSHAQFTLGNFIHNFFLALHLAVTRPVSRCCLKNTENEFSDDSVVIRASLARQ